MRVSTSILVSLLLPVALSATTSPSLNLFSNVTNLPEYSVSLNTSNPPPPEPFSKTYGNLIIVLSNYGKPIRLDLFVGTYVRCIWEIWDVVAHSKNAYEPPEVRPRDEPSFMYQNGIFHLGLRQASSAVVDWKYVELYYTLNVMIEFASKYGMREMEVEAVADGIGAFGGVIRYNGPEGA